MKIIGVILLMAGVILSEKNPAFIVISVVGGILAGISTVRTLRAFIG